MSELSSRKVQSYKGRGEEVLRKSGLGYTVVRPGPLQEEAGGYKALVFDQGGRIREVRGRLLGLQFGVLNLCGGEMQATGGVFVTFILRLWQVV